MLSAVPVPEAPNRSAGACIGRLIGFVLDKAIGPRDADDIYGRVRADGEKQGDAVVGLLPILVIDFDFDYGIFRELEVFDAGQADAEITLRGSVEEDVKLAVHDAGVQIGSRNRLPPSPRCPFVLLAC